jgi:hypothetical protein
MREALFERYGEDLYRLALLLTPGAPQAAAALQRAAGRLAVVPADALGEEMLVGALLAVLPDEQRERRRRTGLIRRGAVPQQSAVLAALVHLPRNMRVALGLGALRSFEASNGNIAERNAALRAIAPALLPRDDAALLDVGAAPEACQVARMALLRGDDTRDDPAVRGHLALCEQCRAAAGALRSLDLLVEETLRAAMRDVRPPAAVLMQAREVLQGKQSRTLRGALSSRWTRLAVAPLVVLLVIGALVLPRPAAPLGEVGLPEASTESVTPRELVRRASTTLYTPPWNAETWHARYLLRWYFADASYADLAGSLWLDAKANRHRAELIHEQGGAPFEFQLGDGASRLWYAAEPRYAESLAPQLADRWPPRVRLELDAAGQREMLDARLASGAWSVAAGYLRQAEAADLQSWGRRTADDGAQLAIIGFEGTTLLGLPEGALGDAPAVTILLSIDITSGQLYEIRELIGPQEQQVGRVVWRYLGSELLTGAASESAFDIRLAWRGSNRFNEPVGGIALPELPIVPAAALLPIARLAEPGMRAFAPASAPPGATHAALIGSRASSGNLLVVYVGEGRRMTIGAGGFTDQSNATRDATGVEEVRLDGATAWLRARPAQRYEALLLLETSSFGRATYVSAQGYSRAELLEVLASIGPLTPETARDQLSLFARAGPDEAAAVSALLGALAESLPPPGQTRRIVARVFLRQNLVPDPLRDPYHLPRYGGRPETLLSEYADGAGALPAHWVVFMNG